VEMLFVLFTLLNYPLPSSTEISTYEKNLGQNKLSFAEFLRVPSWMDQHDEKQIRDLTPQSLYLTGNYKKLLFWIFQTRFCPQMFPVDFENPTDIL
jgi:hypothetical protein